MEFFIVGLCVFVLIYWKCAVNIENCLEGTVVPWFFRHVQWPDILPAAAAIQLSDHLQGRGKAIGS